MPLDSQGDKELLWIRKTWYDYDKPVDAERTVVYGHTTTMKIGAPKGGEIAISTFDLPDGRPAWLAMDIGAYNHVNPGLAALDLATLEVIKQPTLRKDKWFDIEPEPSKFLEKIRHRAKKWRLPDNRKEAKTADSFGLKVLQEKSINNILTEDRAREDINKIGMLIPSIKGYRAVERKRPFTWRRIAKRARKIENQKFIDRDEWRYHGRYIRLGPGTEVNRKCPHLPRPHSFTFYRTKQKIPSTILENHMIAESSRGRAR